jgi:D-sedoheptulose 7-phosphate isomerase
MDYPAQYKAQLLNAIESIDLDKVGQVIQIFKEARAHGRRIFVCGNSGWDSVVSQFLCDIVKSASFHRSSRFRILALSDHLPRISGEKDELINERLFVEQLKNFAEPEDVVMGLCPSGNTPSVVNAIEYASWIGCRTVAVTGGEGGKLAEMAELNVHVPVAHAGNIDDVHLIICHMIGYYFVESEADRGIAAKG